MAPLSLPSVPIGRGSSARAVHAAPRRATLDWGREWRRSQWERPAGRGSRRWVSGLGRAGKQIRSACRVSTLRRARGGCAKVTADPSFLQPGKAAAHRVPWAPSACGQICAHHPLGPFLYPQVTARLPVCEFHLPQAPGALRLSPTPVPTLAHTCLGEGTRAACWCLVSWSTVLLSCLAFS